MGGILCRLFFFLRVCRNNDNTCLLQPDAEWYNNKNGTISTAALCPDYDESYYLGDRRRRFLRQFDSILQDFEQTDTLRLEGSEWDNTLVRNCFIHDTDGDGIFLKSVNNVVIANCTFRNIQGQAAIRGSISGTTRNVLVMHNLVQNVAKDGFVFGQRVRDGIDHENLEIIGNEIVDSGLNSGNNGLTHGMYIQAQDFLIYGNVVDGQRDGNGISVRSSGQVSCNRVSGQSLTGKAGIRYFSDHQVGPTRELKITDNLLEGEGNTIDLLSPVKRYDGQEGLDHVVKTFVITGNVFSTPGVEADALIRIDCDYAETLFSVAVKNNSIDAE